MTFRIRIRLNLDPIIRIRIRLNLDPIIRIRSNSDNHLLGTVLVFYYT